MSGFTHHLIGWMVIQSPVPDLPVKIALGLEHFVGDYGHKRITVVRNGIAFGMREPSDCLPLTSWSLFSDERGLCFVEGSFYDAYGGYWPRQGSGPQLAQRLAADYSRRRGKALLDLSGSFSGCLVDYSTRQVVTFVDRLATKPLYWTRQGDELVVSSNLGALRPLNRSEIDRRAAFQFLTYGFPIGARTILKDVSLHKPSCVQIFTANREQRSRYWQPPARTSAMPIREAATRVASAVESCVDRIHRTSSCALGLGLTGGHDSRVILSALVTRAVPFVPLRWDERNANDRTARRLCALIGTSLAVAPAITDRAELERVRDDAFLYSHGMHRYMSGFPRLGLACRQLKIGGLLLGFAGDVISGGLTIPSPHDAHSIPELARFALNGQMERLSFQDASAILGDVTAAEIAEATAEWEQSFLEEAVERSLVDVAIWQRVANRNLKRILFTMLPVRKHVQIIFPYLDSEVLDAYFSLPVDALKGQRAHSYASFCRVRGFGRFPVSGSPIPLRLEAALASPLQRLRAWQLASQRTLARVRHARGVVNWQGDYQAMYEDILRSPLFSRVRLEAWRREGRITPQALRAVDTLNRAEVFLRRPLDDNSQVS